MKTSCYLLQIAACGASLAVIWWAAGPWVLAINLALNGVSFFFCSLAKRIK